MLAGPHLALGREIERSTSGPALTAEQRGPFHPPRPAALHRCATPAHCSPQAWGTAGGWRTPRGCGWPPRTCRQRCATNTWTGRGDREPPPLACRPRSARVCRGSQQAEAAHPVAACCTCTCATPCAALALAASPHVEVLLDLRAVRHAHLAVVGGADDERLLGQAHLLQGIERVHLRGAQEPKRTCGVAAEGVLHEGCTALLQCPTTPSHRHPHDPTPPWPPPMHHVPRCSARLKGCLAAPGRSACLPCEARTRNSSLFLMRLA